MDRSMVLAWFALAAGVSGVGSAQVPVMTFDGPEANTYFGRSVAHVGDLDGDGILDFVSGGTAYLAGTGMVRAYSGKTGSKLLEVVGPKPSTGFGFRVAGSGDVNGDGKPDFLVATPGYDSAGQTDRGAVWVFSGLDGALIHFLEGDDAYDSFGWSIAGCADFDQDGFDDFVVGMPGVNFNTGGARAYSGRTGSTLYTVTKDGLGLGGGAVVAILDDIDGDGVPDWATAIGNGVRFISGSSGTTLFVVFVSIQTAGASFGSSMSSMDDVNGDGLRDLAVGASTDSTFAITGGTVRILSGRDGSMLATCVGSQAELIGQSVACIKDVNGDGVPDVLTNASYQAGVEKAILFSGATGERLQEILSPNFNPLDPLAFKHNFGGALAGLEDLNGDGIGDFVVGASESHTNGSFSGSVYIFLGGTDSPEVYCTAKRNSAGCTPRIGSKSVASLSVGDQFTVTATKVISQRIGLLAWSLAPATTPFLGGTLCLAPPITRTGPQDSGGSFPQSCTGSYAFSFSQAYMSQQGLAAGMSVYTQYWQRDPAHSDGTGVGLTDALNFDIVN